MGRGETFDGSTTHGICPKCYAAQMAELDRAEGSPVQPDKWTGQTPDEDEGQGAVAWMGVAILAAAVGLCVGLADTWLSGALAGLGVAIVALIVAVARKDNVSW
jgi:hypothetical protein